MPRRTAGRNFQRGSDYRGYAALHIGRTPTVDPAIARYRFDRIRGPWAGANGNSVQVAGQNEWIVRFEAWQACDDVGAAGCEFIHGDFEPATSKDVGHVECAQAFLAGRIGGVES